MDTIVTKQMVEAGMDITSELITAIVAKNCDGLGGSLTYKSYQIKEVKNRDLVDRYLNDEIASVTAVFLAMERAKTP